MKSIDRLKMLTKGLILMLDTFVEYFFLGVTLNAWCPDDTTFSIVRLAGGETKLHGKQLSVAGVRLVCELILMELNNPVKDANLLHISSFVAEALPLSDLKGLGNNIFVPRQVNSRAKGDKVVAMAKDADLTIAVVETTGGRKPPCESGINQDLRVRFFPQHSCVSRPIAASD